MNSTKNKSSFRIADILENEKSSERSDDQSFEEKLVGKPILKMNNNACPINLSLPFIPDSRSRFYPESIEEPYRVQKMPLIPNLHHVSPFTPFNVANTMDFDQIHTNLMKGEIHYYIILVTKFYRKI